MIGRKGKESAFQRAPRWQNKRGAGGTHGCTPPMSRRSPKPLDVRRDFTDNLAQAATGYLRTATVSNFLESDMTLSAKARLFSGT